MGLLKTLCLRIALNKEQRLVIWNALQYSDYHYRRNHQTDNAVVTTTVLNQTERTFGVTSKKYSANEVNEMLTRMAVQAREKSEKAMADAYQRGRKEGISETLQNLAHGRGLHVGDTVVVVEKQEEQGDDKVQEESTASAETETLATEENKTEENKPESEFEDGTK